MTGQPIDAEDWEAVAERYRQSNNYLRVQLDEARATVAKQAEQLAAVKAERDNAVAAARSMDHFADVAVRCERKSNEYAARLAAVKALADELLAGRIGPRTAAMDIRSALTPRTDPPAEETNGA